MRRIIPFLIFFASCANMEKNGAKATAIKGFDIDSKRCEALQDRKEFIWGEWPEEKGGEVFHDNDLAKIIETALQENFSLQSVEARVRKAKGEADVVRSKLYPQLNALFSVIWSFIGKETLKVFPNLDSNFQFYTAAFNFSYEFDFWGKNRKLFEAALGEVKVQEALFQQAKIALSASIAVEYYNLQATAARLRVLSELLENRAKQLELTLLRDKYRIDSLISVNQIKGEVLFLQKSLSALKEELELNKSSLLTLMGHNPTEELTFGLFWKPSYLPFDLPKNIGLDLLAKRADIAAETARVTKSAKLVGVAITEFYPNISLSGLGGFFSPDINNLFTAGGFSVGALPMVQLPIFQGGRIRANLREKIASHESAVHSYNNVILQAANEVVSGINRLMGVNERIQFQNKEVGLVKESYELTDIKYRQGIDSLLTMLQSKEKWLWSEMRQIELERMKYESIVGLIKALGGGFGGE